MAGVRGTWNGKSEHAKWNDHKPNGVIELSAMLRTSMATVSRGLRIADLLFLGRSTVNQSKRRMIEDRRLGHATICATLMGLSVNRYRRLMAKVRAQ